MKRALVGDRIGGVLFDVQEYRTKEDEGRMMSGIMDSRARLIAAIANLVKVVEDMDQAALEYERCTDTTHDLWGQRKSDCKECNNPRIVVRRDPHYLCACGCGKLVGYCKGNHT